MANILLNKNEFLIKDNFTPKRIPFMYNGDGTPKLVYVSESELPSNWKFTAETDNEVEYDIENTACDDWGNPLNKNDFTVDYIVVSDLEQSEIIDEAVSQDKGFIGQWDTVLVEENGDDLIVSDFCEISEISMVSKKIFSPEKYQWGNINIEKQENGNIKVAHSPIVHTISEGQVFIEPCERSWTNGVTLAINYDYVYLQNSSYDIEVTYSESNTGLGDSESNTGLGDSESDLGGLYKILDSEKKDNERIWFNTSNQRAIHFNSTDKTWKLVSFSSVNSTNKTIDLRTNEVFSYQYVSPIDLEWLFGVENTDTKAHTYTDDKTRISFIFPKAGTIANRHSLVGTDTPEGNWETGTITQSTEEESTDLIVQNTVYRELSKEMGNYVGSWSNGITVLEEEVELVTEGETEGEVEGETEGEVIRVVKLIVSGFSENDVNGEYTLFDVTKTGIERVWIRHGNKAIYTISYDNDYWRLCTTVDGVYELEDPEAQGVYKTWKCINGTITNYIFFSRIENNWCIKSCENLHLDFYTVGDPQNPLIGLNTVWQSEQVNGDKELSLRYDKNTFVWRFYDNYNNIISVQKLVPTFWTNDAVVSWEDKRVVTDNELSTGIYEEENFDTSITACSYKKESNLCSYYLVYDLSKSLWKIIERIDLGGNYLLSENSDIIHRIYRLNGSDESYQISWNVQSNRWELTSYLGALHFSTENIPVLIPEPIEAVWEENVTTLFDNAGNIVLAFDEENDANGTYEIEDSSALGVQRIWSYFGTNGKYSIVYDLINKRWSLQYFDIFANGNYTLDDNNASGSSKTWSMTVNDCEYKIAWNDSTFQWNLFKNISKIIARSNFVISATDILWSSGASVFTDNPQSICVSGNAINPEANGVYIDNDPSKTGLKKSYSKTNPSSVYTIFYDSTLLKWSIIYRNIDFNGEYKNQNLSATGNNRVFLRNGENCDYFVKFNGTQNCWELTADDNTQIAYQQLSNSEPTGGTWNTGIVSDPFASANFYNALIPYTLKNKQQYNYTLKGNERSEYQKFNALYEIQDFTKSGKNRVWQSSTGMYIKFLGTHWAIIDNPYLTEDPGSWSGWNGIYAYSETNKENIQDLSTISWSTNWDYFYGTFRISSTEVKEFGSKTFWMAVGDYEETTVDSNVQRTYITSNIVRFTMAIKSDEISNVSMNLIGSTGSKYYTGFFKDANGRFTPTDLVHAIYSATSPIEIRVKFSGGFSIPNVDFTRPYLTTGIEKKTGILTETTLGGTDSVFNITMTVQDQAGNKHEVTQNMSHIARLWRLNGTNIKADDASYQTKLFSVVSAAQSSEIPRSITSFDDFTRQWEDIFYPASHGYPLNADGTINVLEAIRISKDIDETGKNGPTLEELARYDQLQLSTDKTALSVDADNRCMTSGWQRNKTYSRMESSSYGEAGENLRYWIIDNTGYSDLKLEFEYFDLNNQVSNIPPNILSPYDGDVLVVYDAQAEGCLEEIVDIHGKKSYKIQDSSLLVELFAFTGSCYTEDIKMKSGTALPITQTGNGFTTSAITSTSKICLILYTDNDYQGSGFKLKAGPRHNVIHYNYDLNNSTGEAWVHQVPGNTRNHWYSPAKLSSTHQYMTANVSFDYEKGILTLDSRSGATITGDFTAYNYLTTNGGTSTPTAYFGYTNPVSGEENHPELKKFLLYNDDCVDYYEISVGVKPTGIVPDYSNIYSFQNNAKNFGKVSSGYESNKDKGVITFSNEVPLGRIFGSYNYHSYYRLTNDGYGDLYFYDNALVPSSDYSVTGLKDWTYVDLMIYNEGSNSLSEGIMKFMSRGYIEGTGNSQTVTQVVDENRPWDVQSGTVAETVNRTGANFSVSFTGLSAKTRGAAVTAINNTSSGGVSFGSTMLPRSKAYIRLYWCLATSDSNNPSYIVTTRGKKLWSSELSGKYFVVTI